MPGHEGSAVTGDSERSWGPVIGGGLLLAVGLTLAVASWAPALAATGRARSWPAREAEILVSEVGEAGDDQQHVQPIVVYTYRVGDREYLSSRYSFFVVRSFTHGSAQEFVQRYPVGRKVPCRVDPDDPRQALLDPDWRPFDASNASIAFFSTLAVVIGASVVVSAFRR
jgi:hypothetical protein